MFYILGWEVPATKKWQVKILVPDPLELPPPPVTVTTRNIPVLVGNPYKPSFVTVTGWGVDQRDPLIKDVITLVVTCDLNVHPWEGETRI